MRNTKSSGLFAALVIAAAFMFSASASAAASTVHDLDLTVCISDPDAGAASNNCFNVKGSYTTKALCEQKRTAILQMPIEVWMPDGDGNGVVDANSGEIKHWSLRPQSAGSTGNLVKYAHGACLSKAFVVQ